MPARKKDAVAELAEKMLRVLEEQRPLGAGSYPVTVQRLGELTDPQATQEDVLKAVAKKPFLERVVLAKKKEPKAPVVLREDLEELAGSPALLEFVLESLCTPASPAWAIAKLKGKVDSPLKQPFEAAVKRRVEEKTLPLTVGVRFIKNKPELYLNRMPPPPPPAPPKKPEVKLAEDLVRVLEEQRRLGGGSYPLSLGRLVQLTDAGASPELLKKAKAKEPFKSRVLFAFKDGPGAPVALVEDREEFAGSPVLLEAVLHLLRTAESQAFPLDAVKKKVVPGLQQAVGASLERMTTTGTLPPSLGWMWIGKKKLLFLLSDVHGATSRGDARPADVPGPPARPVTPPVDFPSAFDEAFRRLNREQGSHNFVSLEFLRRAVPVPRDVFDRELKELRRAGQYTLAAAEGRHGITLEQREAAVVEDGALLLYVSRKSP